MNKEYLKTFFEDNKESLNNNNAEYEMESYIDFEDYIVNTINSNLQFDFGLDIDIDKLFNNRKNNEITEADIFEVDPEIVFAYIDDWSKKQGYKKMSKLYCKDKNKYIAIDNSNGDCYVEEFDSKEKAITWLSYDELSVEDIEKLDVNIQKWYIGEYPDDELNNEISKNITFLDINKFLNNKDSDNICELLGENTDSIIRERVFSELSKILNVEYEVIYNKGMNLDGDYIYE